MNLQSFFDKQTNTLTYIVHCEKSREAILIDPVLNFDYASAKVSEEELSSIVTYIEDNDLKLKFVFETHVHADHLSAASKFKERYPDAKVIIHENIKIVQETFNSVFDSNVACDGSQFDILTKEGEKFHVGQEIQIEIIETPGHTPACMSLNINNEMLFVGDCIFMPDMGTGRCDFPKGDSSSLYNSIQKIYALPDECKIYVGHDYGPNGRSIEFETTVGLQKKSNIQCKDSTSLEEFTQFRNNRDAMLSAPRLLLPSIQYNMNGARFIFEDQKSRPYIKIPITKN